jgi:hypothetical protein
VSIIRSLKDLVDPGAAREDEAVRRAAREQPVEDDSGAGPQPTPTFRCRVCGHVGGEPDFCPDCLAQTMRPYAAPRAAAPEPEPEPETPATEIPIDGTLDLHGFRPGEIKDLIAEYLAACEEKGLRHVRIVHGKGRGILRRRVERLVGREPVVESIRTADEGAGGWGAMLVTLRRVPR